MSRFASRRSRAPRLGRRPPHARIRLERLEDRTAPAVVPVGGEFQVNTYTAGNQARASVAVDQAGNFVVAWHGTGSDDGPGIFAQRYSAAGVPRGSEFRVNANPDGSQTFPSVAMDPAGNFVVAWNHTDGDVHARRFNSAGEPQGGEFRVNTYTTNGQRFASVVMDSAGNFVVAWQGEGSSDDGGVYAQRYDAAGVPQGGEFRVNTYTTNLQADASVAMDSAGNFVVAWQSYGEPDGPGGEGQDGSGSGIYAQRYNSAGEPQGGEFRVNTYTNFSQRLPSVAMNQAGDFIVTWGGIGQGGDGVYAQRYNAAGVPQGSEFPVTGGPDVAMDQAGNFVVAWWGEGKSGDFNTYAQAYLASGVPDGGEFRVNTYASNSNGFPSIAMNPSGDFVVAWQSIDQDGSGLGIYAQRYKLTAPPHISAVRVNNGSAQRSRVTSLTVTFDAAVSFAGPVASAFALTRIGGGAVSLTATATLVGGVTVVTLDAFIGSETEFGSLRDGRYTLTALASQISVNGQPLDGDGDGQPGGDHALALHRLYGDATGDGRVDNADFFLFRGSFGRVTGDPLYLADFDFNYDGRVDNLDFFQFRTRFGTTLP